MAQARAVSDAAQAAAQATEAAQAVMASAHEARRIEALSRFIQKPDMYKPDTREQEIDQWTDWRHVMRNYLGVIDANYLTEMDVVEARTNEEAVLNAATHPDAARRSRELYAILASFMRNRPLKILRNVAGSNGYEAWRQLMLEMQPQTRQRQLALMTQLNNMSFDPKRSLNEQLGKFDEVVREYERISGTTYPDDLRISTLVSAAPAPLQVQLHMALTPATTYSELKEKVLAYERSTTKWHASSGLQFPAVAATVDHGTPMEIDMVTHGGKKGGGKKGVKKDKGSGKGKDLQRKGQSKGRRQGRRRESRAQEGQPTQCEVSCVREAGPLHARLLVQSAWREGCEPGAREDNAAPSTPSSSVHPQQLPVTPGAKAVRRIKMATPPTAARTEIFDISEDAIADFALDPVEPYFVQMVTEATVGAPTDPSTDTMIILDSGADAAWCRMLLETAAPLLKDTLQSCRMRKATASTAARIGSLIFGLRLPTGGALQ